MFFVGIDFSINSPGICILHGDITRWLSYSAGPKTKAESAFMDSVSACADVSFNLIQPNISSQDRLFDADDYSKNEYLKITKYITRAQAIASLIYDELVELGYDDGDEVHFGFEGFSYGSVTNNIIDIAIATGFLKKELIDSYSNMTLSVMAPGTIKKSAGSGRYKKKEMYDVFVENRHSDSGLETSDFWNLCQTLRGAKKLFKPTDDLIDAYFAANALRAIQLA